MTDDINIIPTDEEGNQLSDATVLVDGQSPGGGDGGGLWVEDEDEAGNTVLRPVDANSVSLEGADIENVGSLDTDILNNADIANASDGTVPTAQGDGTLSMAAVSGGRWTEDGNSPTTFGNGSSHTYTLDADYDQVLIVFDAPEDHGGGSQNIVMRINGKNDLEYDYYDAAGGANQGESRWTIGRIENDSNGLSGEILLSGRWTQAASASAGNLASYTGARMTFGRQKTATSPLNSFELFGESGDFGVTIEVYGREVGSGN